MINALNSIVNEIRSLFEYAWDNFLDLWKGLRKHKVIIGIVLVASLVFNAVYFFSGIWLITYIGEEFFSESPALTYKNELSGIEYPLVSLAKACSYDGGCTETVILFSSKINSVSANEFREFVKNNPTVNTVCFRSSGGGVRALKTISETVRGEPVSEKVSGKPLRTCMADYYRRIAEPGGKDDNAIISGGNCSSACNTALLSSKIRLQIGSETIFKGHATGITNSAEIGIDVFGRKYWLSYSVNKDSAELKELLRKANTPDVEKHIDYVEKVENINHLDDMKTLTRSELLESRIFTHQCDGFGNCKVIDTESSKKT